MNTDDRMRELFDDLVRENRPMGQQKEIIKPKIPKVPFAVEEAVNILRGNIQLSGNNIKTVAITSALAHEGKSSIAFRLAKSMASLEKRVLYLDADIRNSSTSIRYDIPGEKVGLSEYLCGNATKEKIIFHTDDPWMDILFTGAVAPNPSALVSGPLFKELIAFARSIYDYIIVDGKVHYITPDALDPKTGELTVTFTALGSVVILEKAPIVSKNLESDKYENEKVKVAAEQFKSAEEGTAVSDIFAAAGEGTTVKDQNGEDVDISQYKTCGSLVEVAMKLGDEYFTNAECQFEGTVQMDLEQVDYKALLKSAGIDENTSDEDLLNVEEFEAPDYVLAQLNAVSGEASVSTGLKFGFEKVEGSDRPVLVIKGTFNGLGPVALASKAE